MFRQIGEGSTTAPSVSSGRKIKIEPLSQLGRSSSECLECTAVDRYYEVIFMAERGTKNQERLNLYCHLVSASEQQVQTTI